MKKLFLIANAVIFCFLANAQDTIVKRNGEQILSKILEISTSEVKYKKFEFQDGPDFIENKSNIQLIKYTNGIKDEFELEPGYNVSNTKENKTDSYTGSLKPNNKIEILDNSFRYQGKRIKDRELHRILLNVDDQQIISLVDRARRDKKLQHVVWGGLALGAAGLASFAAGDLFGEPALNVFGGICIGVAIPFPIASLVFKNRRNTSNKEAVKLYNSKF